MGSSAVHHVAEIGWRAGYLLLKCSALGLQLGGAGLGLGLGLRAEALDGGLQGGHALAVGVLPPVRLILEVRHLLRQGLHLHSQRAVWV